MALEPIENFDEIEIEDASDQTAAWQEKNSLKAFIFHQNDIDCLLDNEVAIAVRFYMGIRTCDSDTERTTLVPDMMVVGADSDGNDLIEEEGVSGIYNFALPCPRACDPGSVLFHKEYASTITCGETEKTVVHSTDDTCNILAYSISLDTAFVRTKLWQDQNALRSILIGKEDLSAIFKEYDATLIRIYFALGEDDLHRIILIGAEEATNDQGEKYYADIPREYLYTNDLAPCTTTHTNTCAKDSPLCHGCN
ncbi:hypothetical protein H2O64_16270 [Kordia sp. YSTF-M3]|uniref:Uncharacterized protein n=1 Tax=Kordia aestuariivivens TaxID=2759037 RepID=A0ABR7QCU5_9FLAO|nr:hypothetical protein [Kordia aestuariivivens]MBC8756233.1 hypothetical protein [Kordia aestuariivivens]